MNRTTRWGMFGTSILSLSFLLACSNQGTSAASGSGGAGGRHVEQLCVDIPMQIGGTKRVCCKEGEQPTPYRSSCGDEVSVACNAPNAPQTKCVYRTSLQEEILCPDGLDCTQCGTGDQAGMAFWCGSI